MGVKIDITYTGGLRCRSVHEPSQDSLNTDAPKDNQGEGKHFSPTDLLATALGACMLTTMGIAAKAHNVNMDGATAAVEKHMGIKPRRHVEKVTVFIKMPKAIDPHHRTILEKAAHGCPVHASLASTTQVDLQIEYV